MHQRHGVFLVRTEYVCARAGEWHGVFLVRTKSMRGCGPFVAWPVGGFREGGGGGGGLYLLEELHLLHLGGLLLLHALPLLGLLFRVRQLGARGRLLPPRAHKTPPRQRPHPSWHHTRAARQTPRHDKRHPSARAQGWKKHSGAQ